MPETIDDLPLQTFGGGQPVSEDAAAIASLMSSIAFEEEDVRDTLSELFEWAAERFKSDHWSLTERQARILGKPTAQLLNSIWVRLQTVLPDVLGKWCESTPGATAFLLACGIVVVPKIAKQVAITRAAKSKPTLVRDSKAHGTPIPMQPEPAPTRGGVLYTEGRAD